MSQYLLKQRKRRLSPFDDLYVNPYDEEAWYELFGGKLKTRVCTVIIRETFRVRTVGSKRNYEKIMDFRRQNLAYC